jgi:hypothetical protein
MELQLLKLQFKDVPTLMTLLKRSSNTNSQVALFSSLEKEALDPGLAINELLKADYSKKNGSKSPLFVKLIPASLDSIASKTIYITDIDEECRPLDSYTEVLVESDALLKQGFSTVPLHRTQEATYKVQATERRGKVCRLLPISAIFFPRTSLAANGK